MKSETIITALALVTFLIAGCSEPGVMDTDLSLGLTLTPTASAISGILLANDSDRIPTVNSMATPHPGTMRSESTGAELELMLFDGGFLRLSDLNGNPVVLNFWASWCPPCRWEMPSFERIWREYQDRGIVFVGVAVSDSEPDARAFAEKIGVTYPLGLDETGKWAREYEVLGLPTTVLIDAQGNQSRRIANPANDAVLRLFLNGLLSEG